MKKGPPGAALSRGRAKLVAPARRGDSGGVEAVSPSSDGDGWSAGRGRDGRHVDQSGIEEQRLRLFVAQCCPAIADGLEAGQRSVQRVTAQLAVPEGQPTTRDERPRDAGVSPPQPSLRYERRREPGQREGRLVGQLTDVLLAQDDA